MIMQMVLMSLPWGSIIKVVGTVALGGIVGVVFGNPLELIEELFRKIKRKRFTILGERASGKTTLHHFLSTGEILIGEHKQTTSQQKTKKNTLKLSDCELRIKESVDIGGSEDFREQWKHLIKDADYICYLLRGDKVYDNNMEYINKVEGHITHILQEIRENQTQKKQTLYLLVSYLDTIEEYNINPDLVKEKINDILKTKVYKKGTKAFYGSLRDKNQTEEFVRQLVMDINTVKKNK